MIRNATEFLQDVLPCLRMQWSGFRKVKRQVNRKISARMAELGLGSFEEYRRYLDDSPDEWQRLDVMCRITISRFYRDRNVFDCVRNHVLQELRERLAGELRPLRCLSIGCASGEEVYTLSCLWRTMEPSMNIEITAVDINEGLLERARAGLYDRPSFKDMPASLLDRCFDSQKKKYMVKEVYRSGITFLCRDIRHWLPEGHFDLVLCRNLVFMYYELSLQKELLEKILGLMRGGSFLILGNHEKLPEVVPGLERYRDQPLIYRLVG